MDRAAALQRAQQIIRQESKTLVSLADSLNESFWTCAELLVSCRGLVWVTGVGTSAPVGVRFAHILTCCGCRSMFLSPAEGLHGHLGVMVPEDVLVAMSRGGESIEVNQMAEGARRQGVATIAFVQNTQSTLAKSCQHVLPIHSPQKRELMGYLATTSTVAFCAMCDGLCGVVLEVKGRTPEAFAVTHPGGAVGRVFASGGRP